MATTFIVGTPPTRRQLAFLRTHILREKKRAQSYSLNKEKSKRFHSKLRDEKIVANIESQLDHTGFLTSKSELIKETEAESADDINIQIESHVKWLESLREEKHRLFQQLKLVLHEEDERKRLKVEQKVELDKTMSDTVSHLDPRLGQIAIGLKWPLSTSSHLPLQVNQGLLANKAHRVPLLPTPDATAGDAFSAGNGGNLRQLPGEGYQHSSQHLSGLQISVGQQALFPDKRGMKGLPYQYPSSSQYGTLSGVQSPNHTSQLHYQQVPRFIHHHEVPLQGQYMPSYGHPNQLQQSCEKGQTHFIAQDPRHQKVMDHHRLLASLQSPNQLGK